MLEPHGRGSPPEPFTERLKTFSTLGWGVIGIVIGGSFGRRSDSPHEG